MRSVRDVGRDSSSETDGEGNMETRGDRQNAAGNKGVSVEGRHPAWQRQKKGGGGGGGARENFA